MDMNGHSGPADASGEPSGPTGSCLLLHVAGKQMLLPRILVAEVLRHTFVELRDDEDTGLRFFEWRGCQVPHIRNALVGEAVACEDPDEARLVVCYGLQNSRVLPFYGFSVCRRPQLLKVSDQDLEEVTGAHPHPGELMKVSVKGMDAFIPRVDYFENSILKLIH